MHKGKEVRAKCKNCWGISLLSVVGEANGGVLMEVKRRVNERLNDYDQGEHAGIIFSLPENLVKRNRRRIKKRIWVLNEVFGEQK